MSEVADPATRRRWPRLELVELVQATIAGQTDVTVLNVGRGGLLAVGSSPFQVGDVHEFRLRTTHPAPRALVFLARVAHCQHAPERGAAMRAVGLEFVPPQTEQQRHAIDEFMRLCHEHGARP